MCIKYEIPGVIFAIREEALMNSNLQQFYAELYPRALDKSKHYLLKL